RCKNKKHPLPKESLNKKLSTSIKGVPMSKDIKNNKYKLLLFLFFLIFNFWNPLANVDFFFIYYNKYLL
ncbi:MAG TPA: hypothetical protein DHV22_01405, partial [Xanthomarina gelatinilytica]|nr:hypothetical protein [Xanthomarina gelatinilytica]